MEEDEQTGRSGYQVLREVHVSVEFPTNFPVPHSNVTVSPASLHGIQNLTVQQFSVSKFSSLTLVLVTGPALHTLVF